jgi:hypothetical protein
MFGICLDQIEQGRLPVGVLHRPAHEEREGLEVKLLGERPGPVRSAVDLASNRAQYEKLLAALA